MAESDATATPASPTARRPQVLIVGGGFGGLAAARALRKSPVDVTLVDRRNFHLFQPLLYQVATSGLSPGDIASPIRRLLRKQKNTRVLLGNVERIDVARRRVVCEDEEIGYDTLILATGSGNHYFGRPDWEALAPGLKTIEDATEIRTRVLTAFEEAEREKDPGLRRAWLTFVVVGAGPTGVELAGALSELARDALKDEFRNIDSRDASVLLVELGERVLPTYPESLSEKALRALEAMGVDVRLGCAVEEIDAEGVALTTDGVSERIATRCPLWAAGVAPSPLGRELAAQSDVETDRTGRVPVGPDLSVPGHPEIFVIGDLAHCVGPDGEPVPGIAPAAIQQGRHVGLAIRCRIAGEAAPPFRYRHKGSLATIGRSAGVADFGKLRFSGSPAWLLWLFVHILFLVELENRLLVLVQWTWNYFSRNRSTRIIAHARARRADERGVSSAA